MNIRERVLRLALDAEAEGAIDLHYALLYLGGTMDDRGRNVVVLPKDLGCRGTKYCYPWPNQNPKTGIGLQAALRLAAETQPA